VAKGTKLQIDQRVSDCYRLLCSGYARRDILLHASDKGWGLSERQIETYISRARELLLQDAELQRPVWLSEALGRLRKAERHAAELGQPAVVIQSVMAQAKLIGWKDDGA
jgi:hypothetical protein